MAEKEEETARQSATRLTLDTPAERMAEMTSLNRRETFIYPIMEMFSGIGDPFRVPGKLMDRYRESSYRHKRSLGAQQLIGAHKLAQGEIANESHEEGYEESEMM